MKPKTRFENFLAKIANDEDAKEMMPRTRVEHYLNEIAMNGGNSGENGNILVVHGTLGEEKEYNGQTYYEVTLDKTIEEISASDYSILSLPEVAGAVPGNDEFASRYLQELIRGKIDDNGVPAFVLVWGVASLNEEYFCEYQASGDAYECVYYIITESKNDSTVVADITLSSDEVPGPGAHTTAPLNKDFNTLSNAPFSLIRLTEQDSDGQILRITYNTICGHDLPSEYNNNIESLVYLSPDGVYRIFVDRPNGSEATTAEIINLNEDTVPMH